ncbi:MAG: HD domain-containing protein [Gemmatimonadaceae bacterium]|nr:HD domain-containing protein [Gemmatimonadaceae bacterium]
MPRPSLFQEAVISDIALILRAAEFAAHRHRKQRRKGRSKRPYIGHCIEVARLVAEVGGVVDANVLAAALLHDTVEDTKTSRDEIRQEFGAAVDELVQEVTDDKSLDKEERKELQVTHAPHLSPGAKVIKLADKISNVQEIGTDVPKGWDVERREKYFVWAKRVVDAIGPINPELEQRFASTLEESSRLLAKKAAKG